MLVPDRLVKAYCFTSQAALFTICLFFFFEISDQLDIFSFDSFMLLKTKSVNIVGAMFGSRVKLKSGEDLKSEIS